MADPHVHPAATIVAVCNQKGGVGKTTVTINLGGALAHLGYRVLLVDLDPQGHLTEGVGLQDYYERDDLNLLDQLVHGQGDLGRLVVRAAHDAFHVVPTNYQMMLAEQALFMVRNREHKLRAMLAKLSGQFDWILLDCPPILGNLTDNALNAAQKVVIPVQAESTSIRALELLFDQIESIEHGLAIQIQVLAIVPNLVQDSALAKRTLEQMRTHLPNVTPFELRKRVLLQSAWEAGCSVFTYDAAKPDQAKAKAEVVDDYLRLAHFVLAQLAAGAPVQKEQSA